ncbi:uncharacterized protein L3040_008828 [Drepanopeziza brunnea f. sp. 'multigermtubi']|uniref:uncharacterized protein n=1 Tax=Drepanopeziza brunnea f. sp. 'multigermtubi' TaxID=698441 RepID=UPI00238F363F|nr:hypothetical protein L3040_008828 [Drepanopeziza brunnea f. sp. 'multigermtubi']
MVPVTPSRSSADNNNTNNADYTRPQDAASPSNLTQHSKKRRGNAAINLQPPPFVLGRGAPTTNTATKAIESYFDDIDRAAAIKRRVWQQYASASDWIVDDQPDPESRHYAQEFSKSLLTFMRTHSHATTGAATPPPPSTAPHSSEQTAPSKSVSWADSAGPSKTLKNSGAAAQSAIAKLSRSSSVIGIGPAGTRKPTSSQATRNYAARKAIADKLDGVDITTIPRLEATRTGWALTPINLKARDLLITDEAKKVYQEVLGATGATIPVKWYTYAVQGVPAEIRGLFGEIFRTAEHIDEEILAQAGRAPVSVRISQHGADPATGLTCWMVSFLEEVRSFRLFGCSSYSRLVDKKQPIKRHDPGCLGWCNPARCTRHARCSHCGERRDQHDGPDGKDCTAPPRCANCHGPYEASHKNCPAAPKRVNGKVITLTKKELGAVRRLGAQAYAIATAPVTEENEPTPASQPETPATGVNAAPPRKRRALAVQEHERATSSQAVSSQSSSQSSTQATRPLRSTATRKNLNEKTLMDSAFSAIDEGGDTLMATSDYHVDNTTSSSSSSVGGSSIAAGWDAQNNSTCKGQPHHIALLYLCHSANIDVICVQEPYTHSGTKTQNHPSYECYAPIESWDSQDDAQYFAERPRVMTYVRKGVGLRTQQRRSIRNRDLLWVDVNGFATLNVYRQPLMDPIIDYITHLVPPSKCLIGGDFNVWHDMFEPGVEPKGRGGDLAAWSNASGMDYIGLPGDPTHKAGHVLDLTFSNISFAQTTIRPDLHSGSDHETQVTTILSRGVVPLERFQYRVPDQDLEKFASLVALGVDQLPDPWTIHSTEELDQLAISLATAFNSALEVAGQPAREGLTAAPWWTANCQTAYKKHLAARSVVQRRGHRGH